MISIFRQTTSRHLLGLGFFLSSSLILYLISLPLWAKVQPQDLPTPLQPWVNWVLHDTEDYTCPFKYNQSPQQTDRACHWPSQLELKVETTKAEFTQKWQVYSSGWIALPGNAKFWPEEVQTNENPAFLADRNGVPSVFAPKGRLTIKGKIKWQRRPEFLQIPANTGLVTLTIDDVPVTIPHRDIAGRLWLTKRNGLGNNIKKNKNDTENRLDMRVYRRIIDDIPLQVITRIELDVAGRNREVVLGTALLEKHQIMSVKHSLPARLEADGRLRLQVRPGTWTLTLQTRQEGINNLLRLTPNNGQWVAEEIWVFESHNDLRLVEVRGVTAIDPQQTSLPAAWRKFPAYFVRTGESMELVEKRRGDPEPPPDQLKLRRDFWLDFDGKGYSVQDHISGTMTQGWRLETAAPMILGRVAINGQDQFITHGLKNGLKKDGNTGVEVRRGQIDLVADSRLEQALTKLPAVGWSHDFQQVSANLHLPPGWRLFSANGVDHIPDTWLKQWTLLDLFIVLIIATAIGKLWRWWWGWLTLVTLVLIYHEPHAPQFVWLNIIAAVALLRVLPTIGWFSSLVRSYRNLSLIALLIIALPFMTQQVRQSIYPHTEHPTVMLDQSTSLSTSAYRRYAKEERLDANFDFDSEVQQNEISSMLIQKGRSRYYKSQASSQVAKRKKQLMQIDPNAQVQTGPGLPQWEWRNISMRWNGPVKQNQSIQLLLLSPDVNSGLGAARVMLLAILTVFFLLICWGPGARFLFKSKPASKKPLNKQALTVATLFVGALLLLPNLSHAAQKSATEPLADFLIPSQAMLDELKKRLLAAPECLPYCASIPSLFLEIKATELRARMEIHSHSDVAVPLPGSAKQWLPQQVWLDGKPAPVLLRQKDGHLWLFVTKGIHKIVLTGSLPNRNTVQLPLPLKPQFVRVVKTSGWRVEGIAENGVASQQLQFTREQADKKRLTDLEMGSLPPFVQIERTLLLGLDWQIKTSVIRKTPLGTAILLEIPLLNGESVTSEKIRVKGGKALINLSPNQSEISWVSVFDKQETITLTAPDNTFFSNEVWRLDASAIWHVDIEGIPVVFHQNKKGRWLPQWQPWPGETVTLHIKRPEGVPGQVLTIDRSQLIVKPGQRNTDNRLLLKLRSSRAMQHQITLPENALLQSVKIDGKSQPISTEKNVEKSRFVSLPITPGSQQVELRFQQPHGMSQHFYTPSVDLGIDSVNTHIEIKMPSDRWILFVDGAPLGPAVMIWGILIVIVLASVGLGRVSLTPLKTHHWLLLGIVLSQVQVPLMLCVVGWLIVLGGRAQISPDISALKFNATQIGLGILTVIALVTLLMAIEQGLLGHPNMHIAGNGSDSYHLRWYEDRTAGTLPQVWVFSASMWIYRIAMLLWALWLSFALLRWLRWGWECFSTYGLWKR